MNDRNGERRIRESEWDEHEKVRYNESKMRKWKSESEKESVECEKVQKINETMEWGKVNEMDKIKKEMSQIKWMIEMNEIEREKLDKVNEMNARKWDIINRKWENERVKVRKIVSNVSKCIVKQVSWFKSSLLLTGNIKHTL